MKVLPIAACATMMQLLACNNKLKVDHEQLFPEPAISDQNS